jgi:hypothetical protein
MSKFCPNQGFIRTRLSLNEQILSESGLHSDTVEPK